MIYQTAVSSLSNTPMAFQPQFPVVQPFGQSTITHERHLYHRKDPSNMQPITTSKVAGPRRPHHTSLIYSLPLRRLKEILRRLSPLITLSSVEEIPSTQLARLYTLVMSDGRKFYLAFAPSLSVRLLRHESTMLSSEASLLHFITERNRSLHSSDSKNGTTEPVQELDVIFRLIPKLIRHSPNNREMAYPYSIFEATIGAPLSTVSIYLTIPERQNIDKKVGSTLRALASVLSPTGAFGTVNLVLPDQLASGGMKVPTKGAQSWSEGFNLLLEGILRDGEDMSVLLPYQTIRSQYKRLARRLDAVTQPRLLLLNAGSESNVMVERGSEEGAPNAQNEGTKMTGFRSWSQGVFGDPLLSDCFENPSDSFLEGWHEGSENIIEDEENTDVRLLMYRSFRAVVGIVTEYFRPQGDSSRKELEARRNLTSALAELEKIDYTEQGQGLSGDRAENSKRQKLEPTALA